MDSMIIPLNDWAAGERQYGFHAGIQFFQGFGNTEIQDADVSVDVLVRKEGVHKVSVHFLLDGKVTVPCDRCLEPLELPVRAQDTLDAVQEEMISADGNLDLSQVVYDYVCLSLPLQRNHPEGACNPDTVRFLGQQERGNEEAAPSSPFAALKGLFESK